MAKKLLLTTRISKRFKPRASSIGILNSPLFSLLPIAEVEFETTTIYASLSTFPEISIFPEDSICESLGTCTKIRRYYLPEKLKFREKSIARHISSSFQTQLLQSAEVKKAANSKYQSSLLVA